MSQHAWCQRQPANGVRLGVWAQSGLLRAARRRGTFSCRQQSLAPTGTRTNASQIRRARCAHNSTGPAEAGTSGTGTASNGYARADARSAAPRNGRRAVQRGQVPADRDRRGLRRRGGGCGSAAAPGIPAPARVSLTITLAGAPGEPQGHWTVRCDPAGGTHPDPAAVCKALIAAMPFAPQPPRKVCPQIIIDSKAVIITGAWYGKKVHRVVIDGGCDLALFAKLSRIFS